jgi:ATP-dependent Clp protease protease subunit
MIHQPFGGLIGQTTDVQIQAEEILKARDQINQILAMHTGKTPAQIEVDSERDRFFSATEAKEYGLVDEVLEQSPEMKEVRK